ncbi:MAG: hypothetical protein RLO50_04420, partial [Azospirillaceae bacterium]
RVFVGLLLEAEITERRAVPGLPAVSIHDTLLVPVCCCRLTVAIARLGTPSVPSHALNAGLPSAWWKIANRWRRMDPIGPPRDAPDLQLE